MKKLTYILGIAMSAALLGFSGCMKEDIDELRRQQAENAERIAALEEWQTTVNSNIGTLQQLVSVLEGMDYVTSVTKFTSPTPGGYKIEFTKSDDAIIWNGSDGHSPVIAAAQDTDGKYYWTLDGDWLLSGGNKVPTTGEKGDTGATGATPKVAIGSDGYWYVSADGTAAGTPPGAGWAVTTVKAQGEPGPAGPQGDAIFAANGVDNSHADYVVFTLADGTTEITVPKYKPIGISFVRPGVFAAGVTSTINYTSTGSTVSTNVRVVDVPAGWKVSVDLAQKNFIVTPPTVFDATSRAGGEATILIADGDRVAAMYALPLQGSDTYQVGDYFPDPNAVYSNGNLISGTPAIGVVFEVSNGGVNGRIVSLNQATHVSWGNPAIDEQAASVANIRDMNDGQAGTKNLITKRKDQADFATTYGAFNWIYQTKNRGDLNGMWYMPALNETKTFWDVWNADRSGFGAKLNTAGGDGIIESGYFLTLTEINAQNAYTIYVDYGSIVGDIDVFFNKKEGDWWLQLRAVAKF